MNMNVGDQIRIFYNISGEFVEAFNTCMYNDNCNLYLNHVHFH